MQLQPKLIGALIGACLMLAGPAAQGSSWSGGAASSASQAGNSAVQSAVQSARDDAARRAMAHQQWTMELKRARKHNRNR